jgi:translation initiation factor IF-1
MSEQEKRERLEMDGVVIDSNKGQFRVKINDNLIAQCTLAGKIRVNSVKILVGDRVRVELGEYDTSRGRIVYRYKS